MSLRVWLPLTKDLRNQGLDDVTVTNNGATFDSAGKLGGCYSFNRSSSNYLKINNPVTTATNGVSMAFWVKIPSNANGNNQIVHIGNGPGWNNNRCTCFIYQGSSSLIFSCSDGQGTSAANSTQYSCKSSTLTLNNWTHVACTYSTGKMKIYLNGVLDTDYTTTIIPSFTNISYIGVGAAPNAGEPATVYLNDVRIYNHCLSPMEVKQISQGLALHYPLNSNSTYTSLIDKTTATYTIYNNHGVAASLTKQSESYLGAPVYRLSMTPTSDTLNSFRNGLHSHGVYGWRQTFAASTKYVFWIYYRPVTHMDVRVGGTASNISGWTEIPPEYIGNGWYRVGQYRNGTVTEAKSDNIFTSFYSPTAEAGVPIEIDFACPTLVQGLTEIQPSINWDVGNIIYDTSGYCNNGTINGLLSNSSDTPKYKASTYMPKTASITHPRPVFGGVDQEWTCAMWVKLDTVNQSGIAMNNFNSGNNIVHSANGMPLLYANSGSNDYYNYGNKAVTAGVWTHVVFVFRNSDVTKLIYINGVEQTNKNGPNRTSTPSGIQDVVTVGYNLAGYISDYRVYATALSASDVLSLYQNCATIDPDGTIRGQIRS